jgi:ketosteroid isomerase-like protein
MPQENVERVRDNFRRFQSGDQGWIETIDPDIEWDISAHPLPDVPNRGRGKEQLLSEVLATYLRGWLDYRSEIREAVDAGDDVVVVLHETARLRDSDTALDRDLIQVWTVREGAAVFFRVFPTKQAALEALGLREEAISQESVEVVRRIYKAVSSAG